MEGKKRMSKTQKLMAYVLSTDSDLNRHKNITQKEIADVLGFSQPTIAQNLKEVRFQMRIRRELEEELSSIKNELMKIKRIEILDLPSDI